MHPYLFHPPTGHRLSYQLVVSFIDKNFEVFVIVEANGLKMELSNKISLLKNIRLGLGSTQSISCPLTLASEKPHLIDFPVVLPAAGAAAAAARVRHRVPVEAHRQGPERRQRSRNRELEQNLP